MTHMESYLIGTLFEEEEKDKKQNFYNQIVFLPSLLIFTSHL